MFETSSFLVLILEFAIGLTLFYLMMKKGKQFMKKRRLEVSTPRLKGRSILIDKQIGSAVVVGYSPLGNGYYMLKLLDRDGHVFSSRYHATDIFPENPIHAIAGATTSKWRVRGQLYHDLVQEPHAIMIQDENKRLKDEKITQSVKKKQEINEAALLPDKMEELIKEMLKPAKQDNVKVIK